MDFPEVWQFKVKQKALKHETFSSNDAVALKLTYKLPIIKMISILLPEVDTTQLSLIINDSDYYSTETFKLTDVLTRGFIDGFLKTGKFFCASNEECSEDTFSIVNNKLVIKIHKDTIYSSKAVELSNFKSKTLDENNITTFVIDLLQDKLELTKLREEIKDLTCETSVNFLWLPKADDVCSSSIAKYFTDAGNSVKLCKNRYQERPEYGLKLPLISDDEFGFLEISEYVGMVLLGCNIEATDFSSYRIPSEHVEIGKGKVIHSKGFIGQQTIQQVIDEVRKILSRNPSIPWIALSIIISANHSKLLLFTNDKIYSL